MSVSFKENPVIKIKFPFTIIQENKITTTRTWTLEISNHEWQFSSSSSTSNSNIVIVLINIASQSFWQEFLLLMLCSCCCCWHLNILKHFYNFFVFVLLDFGEQCRSPSSLLNCMLMWMMQLLLLLVVLQTILLSPTHLATYSLAHSLTYPF